MPTGADLQQFLDGIIAELDDVPDRTYVGPGNTIWDCEQLVVYPRQVVNGTTDNSVLASRGCAPATVTVVVEQVWCIPVAKGQHPPSADIMTEAGRRIADGATDLYRAAAATIRAMRCGAAIDDAEMLVPQGGYVGWQVRTRWTL